MPDDSNQQIIEPFCSQILSLRLFCLYSTPPSAQPLPLCPCLSIYLLSLSIYFYISLILVVFVHFIRFYSSLVRKFNNFYHYLIINRNKMQEICVFQWKAYVWRSCQTIQTMLWMTHTLFPSLFAFRQSFKALAISISHSMHRSFEY